MKERDFIQIVVEMWPVTRTPEGCQIMLKYLDASLALAMMNNRGTENIRLLRSIVWQINQNYSQKG